MKHWAIRACLVACLGICGLSCFGSEDSAADADVKSKVEEAVARIRAGHLSQMPTLRQLGKKAVPFLIEHADDDNPDVRRIMTMALGESLDERAIPVLLDGLLDADSNVRRTAIRHLYYLWDRETLKKHLSETMLELLAKHAARRTGSSYMAALLIGDLGGKSQMDALRKILKQAESIWRDVDHRTVHVAELRDSCLKALFKLGDEKTTQTVVASLKRDDVASIVFGIEAVAYAGKKEYIKDLLPFLGDNRDAVRPSPGWNYLRVRDIAVNAIVELSGVRPSFKLRTFTPYTDEQVAEVKKLVAEGKTR